MTGSTSPALRRVAKGSLCSGCGGCALIAPDKITMEKIAPGYLRPVQSGPLEPNEENAIAKTCPGLGQVVEAGDRTDDVLWGPYVEMCTGHATDEALRHRASSGGALSALLMDLLNRGEIDGVVQTGADPAVPVGNQSAVSQTAEDILMASGSRYAPSAPLEALTPHLGQGRRLAVVGKPCDIAALRALALIDPRIDETVAYMVSFFCGGVPSETGAQEVVRALGVDPKDAAAFRYRGMGWPGLATVETHDGQTASMTYHESWGKILSRHVQHRCKICADGSGMAADIVCADAWEADDKGYPLFEEAPGMSLIVARTALGAGAVAQAKEVGAIATEAFDINELTGIQKGQFWRRRVIGPRLAALRLMGRPAPRYRGLNLRAVKRYSNTSERMRNFLGMIRRVIQGRL